MRRITRTMLVALALALAAPLAAQEGAAPAPAATGVENAAVQAPAGLPRRAPQPRTMEAEWPVFAVFAAGWVGIVGYLVVIGRRSRRVAAAIDRVEGVAP